MCGFGALTFHGRGLQMLSPATPLQFKAGEDVKSLTCSLGAGFWFPFIWSHCISLTTASRAGSPVAEDILNFGS